MYVARRGAALFAAYGRSYPLHRHKQNLRLDGEPAVWGVGCPSRDGLGVTPEWADGVAVRPSCGGWSTRACAQSAQKAKSFAQGLNASGVDKLTRIGRLMKQAPHCRVII